MTPFLDESVIGLFFVVNWMIVHLTTTHTCCTHISHIHIQFSPRNPCCRCCVDKGTGGTLAGGAAWRWAPEGTSTSSPTKRSAKAVSGKSFPQPRRCDFGGDAFGSWRFAISALGEDDPAVTGLKEALRQARLQAQVRPVEDRIKATKMCIERSRKRVDSVQFWRHKPS